MIVGGYDTDDLTDRQNLVFRKLYNNSVANNNLLALNFLSYSVRKNFQYGEFYNYEDDCDYLLRIQKNINQIWNRLKRTVCLIKKHKEESFEKKYIYSQDN